MNDESEIRAVLDRLVGTLEDEAGDWDDVLNRARLPRCAPEERRLRERRRPWRSRRGRVLLATAVTAAAVVALVVESPWRSGPSILDRAAAAIVAPGSGQILSESIAIHGSSDPRGLVVHVKVWIDGARPHRFRVTVDGPRTVELGGTLGRSEGLNYSALDHVLDPVAFELPVKQSHLDPAAFIKAALTSGRAKPDGKTTLQGREVIRIRVISHRYGKPETVAIYFVDAHTYRPVRIVITQNCCVFVLGFRLPTLSVIQEPSFTQFLKGQPIFNFSEYRELRPTAANRRLANIRAQHPNAELV
jgi:hypothetical protein